ncbi:MAG TPA: family 16 glycoside hydrolase [Anaerolineae bacterium]|nr:family 16 glycoside hydrolase [Anaerolineae bacterium]
MGTSTTSQRTDFTLDVLGRYVCNGLDEALRSADTTLRADARPFDVIVIGGGSFGPVLAQHLFSRDETHRHRILVLEGGPFVLPEHVQNLPMLGLNVPGKTSIADLRAAGQDGRPRSEVWGLAWHSDTQFPGLAYCVGGRSLFFGGWSPQLLEAEMPAEQWPSGVVHDLNARYFREAAEQIGVNETNDFIHGPLHDALRRQLFEGINAGRVTDAIPLAQLPLHLDVPPGTPASIREQMKLEAPLAVQSRAGRSGFFPFNKFSAVPLLMKAARQAWFESGNDDVKKRLMIVPNCHVRRLKTAGGRVTEVETNLGNIPVSPRGVIVIALGTIESARLALLSFEGIPGYHLIGRNLMAHLRSNLTIRIPRSALPLNPAIRELQASALFVKGRHVHSDGTPGHFHLQITAAGLGASGKDSEAELFKLVPDVDGLDTLRAALADDTHVVITIRGIGEMEPHNPDSHVTVDPEPDEFGVRRAFVSIAPTEKDLALWDAMDRAAGDVAKVLAGSLPFEVLSQIRDGLGTTHHEAGTLWMGDDPATSVADADGRFHHVANAYAAGPALFPTIGSPNPMLTGVALARRTADRLLSTARPTRPEAGFESLFDGTESSFKMWQSAGQGTFALVDGAIVAEPGGDLGLLYYASQTFGDFVLRLQFRLDRTDDNSGIFVRFRDPHKPAPVRDDPSVSHPPPGDSPAWVAVHTGFEVQIDELARGDKSKGVPDGLEEHRTAAIYGIPLGQMEGTQVFRRSAALEADKWHDFEIKAVGDTYTVYLNGQRTTQFTNVDPFRGKPPEVDPHSGYVGLQAHTGRVAFRHIRILAHRTVTLDAFVVETSEVEAMATAYA